jgi:NAD(P)-dependent dehydrogenase (short-subunit alcohol dehydrogenase family)
MKLRDKTVWITGASSGVGEGMARVFHREGAELIISARRQPELERVRAACTEGPGGVRVLPFDMADTAALEAAAGHVLAEYPRLDILVNNAGISQRALATDAPLNVDRRVMEVDFFGPVALAKAVLPRMLEQRAGHLVVTSSVAGKHGVPYRSAYCAAKHALHGYFDTLRIELLEYNIDVMLLVIAGVASDVGLHALTADGSEFGVNDWQGTSGIAPEECAARVVDAILNREYEPVISIDQALEAMRTRERDPVAFTERMAGMMKWMAAQAAKR